MPADRSPQPPLTPDGVQRFLQALSSTTDDAVAVARNLEICAINEACLSLFGYDEAEELVGKPVLELVARDAQPLVVELGRRTAMHEALPDRYITKAVRRDGDTFDVELRTVVFDVDGETFVFAIHRPLPEADDTVRMSLGGEDFYRSLFEDNPAIKLLISPTTGDILDANEAAVDFYGWTLDELRRRKITEINTLTPEEVREEMENARIGRRRYFRFRHRIASGEVRHVEVHSGPIHIGDQQLLLSIIHDVTERDALEDQLRESQRLEAVGRLAGAIAHDFNNLLTVVLSASEMSLRQAPSDAPHRSQLEDLNYAARRAAELSRELLAFSKRQLMRPRFLDLNQVVEQLGAVMQRMLGELVRIEVDLDDELPPTRVDPRQIEQVLMNLVLNARDAMPEGGRVTIRTRAFEARGGEPVPEGTWAVMTVADQGCGMDEQTRARVFEPFFTTKGEESGTGLGLATVYGIVSQSGGHVTIDSEPGAGCRVDVYLPVTDEPIVEPPEPVVEPARVSGRTLLLVEDREAVRAMLARGLEDRGYRVIEADSAEDALGVLHDRLSEVDALISDVVMPGRSGVELAEEVLAHAPALPVMLVSGDLRGHEIERLPDTVRTLQKPFTASELVVAVDEMLAGALEAEPAPPEQADST